MFSRVYLATQEKTYWHKGLTFSSVSLFLHIVDSSRYYYDIPRRVSATFVLLSCSWSILPEHTADGITVRKKFLAYIRAVHLKFQMQRMLIRYYSFIIISFMRKKYYMQYASFVVIILYRWYVGVGAITKQNNPDKGASKQNCWLLFQYVFHITLNFLLLMFIAFSERRRYVPIGLNVLPLHISYNIVTPSHVLRRCKLAAFIMYSSISYFGL